MTLNLCRRCWRYHDPLYGDKTFTDFMKDIKLPAIVVADGRLGSINRAVLTCEYAKLHGIEGESYYRK